MGSLEGRTARRQIQILAEEAFGDARMAKLWLRRPLMELDGKAPLAMARTGDGSQVIRTILGKIAWGAAA